MTQANAKSSTRQVYCTQDSVGLRLARKKSQNLVSVMMDEWAAYGGLVMRRADILALATERTEP